MRLFSPEVWPDVEAYGGLQVFGLTSGTQTRSRLLPLRWGQTDSCGPGCCTDSYFLRMNQCCRLKHRNEPDMMLDQSSYKKCINCPSFLLFLQTFWDQPKIRLRLNNKLTQRTVGFPLIIVRMRITLKKKMAVEFIFHHGLRGWPKCWDGFHSVWQVSKETSRGQWASARGGGWLAEGGGRGAAGANGLRSGII